MFRRNIACFWYFIVAFPITLFYNSCRLCNRSVIRSCCTSYWSNRKYPRIAVISPAPAPPPAASLHLVRPLGFDISDRAVKRAGLDYWHLVDVQDYDEPGRTSLRQHPEAADDLWLATTKAPQDYTAGPVLAGLLAVLRQGDGRAAGVTSARPTRTAASACPCGRRPGA